MNKEKKEWSKGYDSGYDSGYDDGFSEGACPGNETEIGDVQGIIIEYAKALCNDPLERAQPVTYKEVNKIKRELIEFIDKRIEV